MITVKRVDYKAVYDRRGKEIKPDRYECRYYSAGKELAWYDSYEDVLYLNSRYIDRSHKKDFDKAVNGKYAEEYKYLFAMLKVDGTSRMSEYMAI